MSNITSTIRTRPTWATLPVALFLAASFLAGGYFESTYSLLAAATWLGLALAGALGAARRPSPAFCALVAFGGWTALSALWGPAGPALRTMPLVALYAGALLAAEWVDGDRLLVALAGALTLVCAAALSGGAAGLSGSRLDWPVTYANGLGLVAVSGVLLAPVLRGRLALAAGAICGVAAVLTFSRNALLVGVAAAFLLPRFRIPRRVALAAAIPLVVLAAVLAHPVAARFAAPAPDEHDARRLLDVSGHGRSALWRSAWHEARAHPLAGGGAGSWARSAIADTHSLAEPAHSLPLETFAELGAVGLALLLAFLALALRGTSPTALAVVAAFALHSLTDWDWQLPAATLPAIVAAGAARRSLPAGLPIAAGALVVGILCGLHGLGAALLEQGRPQPRLLPYDARPWAELGDFRRACAVDPGEPALVRADHSNEGCPRPPAGRSFPG
ncbi:MAG: O-antigen ligase family protein [Gaiellaceae bacterium]